MLPWERREYPTCQHVWCQQDCPEMARQFQERHRLWLVGTISGGYRWVPNVSCIQHVYVLRAQPPSYRAERGARLAHPCWDQGWQRVGGGGCTVLDKKLQPLGCQSALPAVNKPYPSMTWCGSCCRGSSGVARVRVRIPDSPSGGSGPPANPAVQSHCGSLCVMRWRNGPVFLRALRNIQPHPLIVKGGFSSVQGGMFPALRPHQCPNTGLQAVLRSER